MKGHFILAALLMSALVGCHNYTNDYMNAKTAPALKTPPNVSQPVFVAHNPIPEAHLSDSLTPASLVPPGLTDDEAMAPSMIKDQATA